MKRRHLEKPEQDWLRKQPRPAKVAGRRRPAEGERRCIEAPAKPAEGILAGRGECLVMVVGEAVVWRWGEGIIVSEARFVSQSILGWCSSAVSSTAGGSARVFGGAV